MAELKDAWKQTAKSVVLALSDLSISLFKTAQYGVDAAVKWAKKDNPHVQAEGKEVPDDPEDSSPDQSAEE